MASYSGEIRKAVIPVAGLGTRFLPISKAIPKEMLPLVDRPAIDYVVREAVAAGLDDVLFIQGRGKGAIEDYFDRSFELEAALQSKGDDRTLQQLKQLSAPTVHSVRQRTTLGLGHAVAMAEEHVGNRPFAVLLGDDLIDERDAVLDRMLEVRRVHGGSVTALCEVPPEHISKYGAVSVRPTEANDVVEVTDLVEKPPADQAPSNLAIIGRYVLDPVVFDVLRETKPGREGEIQLTDALRAMATLPASSGGGVRGIVFRGRRYDTGDKQSYLRAFTALALDDPELGRDYGQWLAGHLSDRGLVSQ